MKSRRKFLSVTGLVVGGVSVGGLQAIDLSGSRSAAEAEVFKVVSQYGTAHAVQRTEGRKAQTCIKVRMGSKEAFAETFVGPGGTPFERIHASGNELRFEHRGVEFLLENIV